MKCFDRLQFVVCKVVIELKLRNNLKLKWKIERFQESGEQALD